MNVFKKSFSILIIALLIFTAASVSAAGPVITVIDGDVPYPEGPCLAGKKLYYVSYGGNKVLCAYKGKIAKIWEAKPGEMFKRGGPSSVIMRKNGNLLIACYDTNELVEIDGKGNQIAVYDKDKDGRPFTGPNDFTMDKAGGIYFTASGVFDLNAAPSGKVYYISSGNMITDASPGVIFNYSNGLAIADGGKSLLVNEHLAGRITKLDIVKPGVCRNPGTFADIKKMLPNPPDADPKIGLDGLKVSAKSGNVYACQYGGSRIIVLDKKGEIIRLIGMPFKFVTNVALKDGDEKVLYVTAESDSNNPEFKYRGKLFKVVQ